MARDDAWVALAPAHQRIAVSEGMALGIMLNGRKTVPFDKFAIDLAFEGAFRDWSYAARFPRVRTDLRSGTDGVWVLTHANDQTRVRVLFWHTSERQLTIHAFRSDWDPANESDLDRALGLIDGGVPAQGWVSLASDFLERIDR